MSELQVTFRHMESSEPLRQLAEEKLAKLRSHFPDAMDCHVVIDSPAQGHHRKGNEFVTHVEVTVGRQHTRISAEASHEDAYAGMRQAFENLTRQIESKTKRTG